MNSVIIYPRIPKLDMSTHFFKISFCFDKKWEIKLCISVNIYHRLPKLGMNTHLFKIGLCYDEKWEIKLCIVRCNLAVHCSGIPFIKWQPIWRPRLLERVYKPIHTPH